MGAGISLGSLGSGSLDPEQRDSIAAGERRLASVEATLRQQLDALQRVLADLGRQSQALQSLVQPSA